MTLLNQSPPIAKRSMGMCLDTPTTNVSEWLRHVVLSDCEHASSYSEPIEKHKLQTTLLPLRILATRTNRFEVWQDSSVEGLSADLYLDRSEAIPNLGEGYFGVVIETESTTNCTSYSILYDPMPLRSANLSVHDLFSSLVAGSPAQRKQARNSLLSFEPAELVAVALSDYDRVGNSEILLHLRSVLEDLGRRAWNSLKKIAESGREECELFIRPIFQCAQVQATDRIAALRSIAINPSPSVRSRLYEFLRELRLDDQKALLDVLAKDPDSEIRAEAVEWLSSLNEDH